MDFKENLSKNLKAIKNFRSQSLTEMAAGLEISRSQLQKLIECRANPTLNTVKHLAEQLDVNPSALLLDSDVTENLTIAMLLLKTIDASSRLEKGKRARLSELFSEIMDLFSDD